MAKSIDSLTGESSQNNVLSEEEIVDASYLAYSYWSDLKGNGACVPETRAKFTLSFQRELGLPSLTTAKLVVDRMETLYRSELENSGYRLFLSG